jgi:hypothetical protein
MKRLIAFFAFLIIALEMNGQSVPCGFDLIRDSNNNTYESERFLYNELSYWRQNGQIPREYPNPDEYYYDCDYCLTIEPTLTQRKFVIPIVVHVVHLPSHNTIGTGSNISMAQIQDQINQLNSYFSNQYGGSNSVNTGIQFCLAPVGPDGNGVIRYSDTMSNHDINNYNQFLALNTTLSHDKYLHIFTCNDIITDPAVKGYSSVFGDKYQGVVIEYKRFGSYDALNSAIDVDAASRGKVLAHEVGHFLGLLHTFEGGCGVSTSACDSTGDLCCDTPPVSSANTNCSNGRNSCYENYGNGDRPDQTENYMDYAGEDCQNTFTQDQTEIMHFMLLTKRTSLVDPTHINSLNLPCATFSAFFKPASTTVCQNDSVQFTALKYQDTNKAQYFWEFVHNGSFYYGDTGFNKYSIKVKLTSVGTYKVILTIKYNSSIVTDTLIDAVLAQNCGTPLASSQGNWYFGQYAGIKFSTNGIVNDITPFRNRPNAINSDEGCVVQSTDDGRLLFYGGGRADFVSYIIDSFYVYDKTHSLMPNGTLIGSSSSMQGGIIVPHPQDKAKYFLLINNHLASDPNQSLSKKGLRWSLVDTSLNSGKGDVVANLKNIPVKVPLGAELINQYDSAVYTGEGIASVPHCDGQRHWIITGSGNENPNNKVHVFISDTNGISYHHTDIMDINSVTIYSVTASKDGNFVCIAGNLFSFNRITGELTFLKGLNNSNYELLYSEFSPNSQVLYSIPVYGDTAPVLKQTDLRNSDFTTTSFPLKSSIRMLQLGPDDKIYMAQYDEGFLSIIENPNAINTQTNPNACGYRQDAISLNPNGTSMLSKIGLPNMIDAISPSELTNDFNYSSNACRTYQFRPFLECSEFYIWDFGDGDTAHGYYVEHEFENDSNYAITLYTDSDTIIKVLKIGMQASMPSIAGPISICDTSFNKNYSIVKNNSNYLDSISRLTWVAYQGNLSGRNGITNIDVKWLDEGRLTLIYEDYYKCRDSVWIEVEFPDSNIYNNVISKTDTIYCSDMELTTITGTIPLGGSGNYEYYWFRSDSSNGPWFLVKDENDDTLFNSYPIHYYYRKVVSDGCEHISNVIYPSTPLITNNFITDSIVGCITIKLVGSIPSSPTNIFNYRWFADAGNGDILLDDTLKDLTPFTSKNTISYYRQVKSSTCINNSNTITVLNFDLKNTIRKKILFTSFCSPIIEGSPLDTMFDSVSYLWQTSTDTTNWIDLTNDTGRNFDHSITDTILRYYRRMAIKSSCISYSNTIENKAVTFNIQPYQKNTCVTNAYPVQIRYLFNKPSYISFIDKIWQIKKVDSSNWKSIYYLGSDDTSAQLNESMDIIGGGSIELEPGDTLRMLYLYTCDSTYTFYSDIFTINTEDTLQILSHPQDSTVNSGFPASFNVTVNYPLFCNYIWQYASSDTGTWKDISNSNNDTFYTELTGGCLDTIYYRAKILHSCGIKYSNSAKLIVTGTAAAFDYWLKDQWTDTGKEFNNDSLQVALSPDIWLRRKKDGIKMNQFAKSGSDTNWIYATIRNKGTQPTKSAKLFLYWSWGSTGEWWDGNWTYNSSNRILSPNGIGLSPMGGEINKEGLMLDSILPGDSINVAVPWTRVPQLNWYDLKNTFWKDRINVCYLARIQTCDVEPFGITFKEYGNVRYNAYHNNNIALRNSYVVYLFPPVNSGNGGVKKNNSDHNKSEFVINNNIISGGTIRIRNQSAEDVLKVCLNIDNSSYLNKANAYIEIGQLLHEEWLNGGSVSNGLQHIVGRIYKLTSTNACLSNISVDADFQDNISLLFGYSDIKNRFTDYQSFNLTIKQYNNNDETVGECIFAIRDNAFVPPTVISNTTELNTCNFDGNGGYLKYNVSCTDIPYTIWDNSSEEYITNNSSNEYYLTPGTYIITCNDVNYNRIFKTTLTIGSNDPTDINIIDTVSYNCDSASTIPYTPTCSGGILYDRFNSVVNPFSGNLYYLDASNGFYTYECADTPNCTRYTTQINFKDIIDVPTFNSNYITGSYDRSDHPCCFVDLSEVTCDGETPLSMGQYVEIYDMTPSLLYSTNLEFMNGMTLGFRFCPPQWDTNSSNISNWYSIVLRNDECSFCRMDFKCDSLSDPEPFVIVENNEPKDKQNNFLNENVKNIDLQGKNNSESENYFISIFPNPAYSEINIKAHGVQSKSVEIRISDAAGKSILVNQYDIDNSNLNTKIALTELSSGVYTIYIPELNFYYKLVVIK